MTFWDSSAVIPLLVDEPASVSIRQLSRSHGVPTVWWGSYLECCSALERRSRAGQLTFEQKRQAEKLLHQLSTVWIEVQPTLALRDRAVRLLSPHNLRAADASQLAAALIWAGDRPSGRIFVCLDSRLREGAQREGFTVVPETPA